MLLFYQRRTVEECPVKRFRRLGFQTSTWQSFWAYCLLIGMLVRCLTWRPALYLVQSCKTITIGRQSTNSMPRFEHQQVSLWLHCWCLWFATSQARHQGPCSVLHQFSSEFCRISKPGCQQHAQFDNYASFCFLVPDTDGIVWDLPGAGHAGLIIMILNSWEPFFVFSIIFVVGCIIVSP